MTFTLPYPPSVNSVWRIFTMGKHARIIKSKEGRIYNQVAAQYARAAGVKPLAGPVAIELDVYRPRKSGDLDNSLKVLIDSLKGIAFEDDNQIVEISARRFDDAQRPRVEVSVAASTIGADLFEGAKL